MRANDLVSLTAVQQRRLIGQRKLSPVELMQACDREFISHKKLFIREMLIDPGGAFLQHLCGGRGK
jgi:hypothetical protein